MSDNKTSSKNAAGPRRKTVSREAHWIEWATGFLCTLLVLAMTGSILYDAVAGSDSEPDLTVAIMGQKPSADGFQVSFTIANKGQRTAADVPVRGILRDRDRVIEEREITFDYVPGQSNASGVLLFANDPKGYLLDLHATGYTDP